MSVNNFEGQFRVLYAADKPNDLAAMTNLALGRSMERFEELKAEDGQLPHPIIDRNLAVAVALRPDYDGQVDAGAILAIGQIGEIKPELLELFLLKAISRAVGQRKRGTPTDTAPMARLAWLHDDSLYLAASASVNGLPVGFAGGWPHHSRELAIVIASSLSNSMSLPAIEADNVPMLTGDATKQRLAWLNQGQNAGDNTEAQALVRDKYRFVLPLVDRQ